MTINVPILIILGIAILAIGCVIGLVLGCFCEAVRDTSNPYYYPPIKQPLINHILTPLPYNGIGGYCNCHAHHELLLRVTEERIRAEMKRQGEEVSDEKVD
jgi:uncharacterized protein YneF (UPF0154 family)